MAGRVAGLSWDRFLSWKKGTIHPRHNPSSSDRPGKHTRTGVRTPSLGSIPTPNQAALRRSFFSADVVAEAREAFHRSFFSGDVEGGGDDGCD